MNLPTESTDTHFVAYHSADLMGYELDMSGESDSFTYYSRKSRQFLERSIGCHAWLIGGSRSTSRRTIYSVVSAYTPTEIRDDPKDAKAHIVFGEHGTVFSPPVVLNDFDWFQELFREQNHFSFGFNPVRSPNVCNALQQLLQQHTHFVAAQSTLTEGASSSVVVTAYERNPIARQHCIEHYGCACVICGFSFADEFGEQASGYIHVHHIEPVSSRGGTYEVDPIEDLRPVCPNCHAVIHLRQPAYSIAEVKHMRRHT